MRRWLDFVAIGTIGDVAPLDGDNRALVRAGLNMLARGGRHGTRALAEIAQSHGGTPTGEDVSFRFAPRINAPGRLDKPDLALSLLLAGSETDARQIAVEVEGFCTRRKEVERGVLSEALAMLEAPSLGGLPGIVLARQGWHPGVVGIVAGRLASRFGKPTVVIALEGARGRGSARGPAGFSVYDALDRVRDVLIGFGGHHAAAGVEVQSDLVETLRDRFADACASIGVPEIRPHAQADALLEEGDPAGRVVGELERFEPCGQGNPAPRIAIPRSRVLGVREMRGGHLRLWIDVDGTRLSCFGADMGSLAGSLGAYARVVGALRRDTWTGGAAVEMRLVAVESA